VLTVINPGNGDSNGSSRNPHLIHRREEMSGRLSWPERLEIRPGRLFYKEATTSLEVMAPVPNWHAPGRACFGPLDLASGRIISGMATYAALLQGRISRLWRLEPMLLTLRLPPFMGLNS
jgi:hypothetical protein